MHGFACEEAWASLSPFLCRLQLLSDTWQRGCNRTEAGHERKAVLEWQCEQWNEWKKRFSSCPLLSITISYLSEIIVYLGPIGPMAFSRPMAHVSRWLGFGLFINLSLLRVISTSIRRVCEKRSAIEGYYDTKHYKFSYVPHPCTFHASLSPDFC